MNSKQSRRKSGRMRNHRSITAPELPALMARSGGHCAWGDDLLHPSEGIFLCWGVESSFLGVLKCCLSSSMQGGKGKLFLILLSPVSLYLSVAFPEYCSQYFITGLPSLWLGDCCHCTHSHIGYLIQSLWVLRKDFPQPFHCCWHLDQHPNLFIWHFPFPINLWRIPHKMVRAGNALSSI